MAKLGSDQERELRAARRSCGSCSVCCSVLRVDELEKPAGRDCVHQQGEAGCGIYESRPPICRAYKCLWLQGGLEDDERPDRTGGIVDLESRGIGVALGIREIRPGSFDASPALRAIAERYREQMPVRITDNRDLMNPDRPFRVLLSDAVEHRVTGDRTEVYRDGEFFELQRLGLVERFARRIGIGWRAHKLRRSGISED